MKSLLSVLLIAPLCSAQVPVPAAPAQVPAPAQAPAATSAATLTVPAGTAIPLTLVTPIYSKSTPIGASVRATIGFPVMAGNQVAIPAGSYVEGMLSSVTARDPKTHLPTVQIHFIRLVFANGYSVPLDGQSTHAKLRLPEPGAQPTGELAFVEPLNPAPSFTPEQTVPTQLPPLPQEGPPMGLVIGLAVGVPVVLVGTLLLVAHRNGGGHGDTILFDNGWQFQMVLQTPLTLNEYQVSAALSPAAAQ